MLKKKKIDPEIKKILIEQRKEYQRYLGVISDEFKSQIKLIIESLGGIQKQLVALRDMVAKNTEDIELIKIDIQFIKHDLGQKVDRSEFIILEKRISHLESKIKR